MNPDFSNIIEKQTNRRSNTFILVFLSAIFIYNTATILQTRYSFYISFALSAIFVFITLVSRCTWPKISINIAIFGLILMAIFVLFCQFKGLGSMRNLYVSDMWNFIFWSAAFFFIVENFDIAAIRKFVVLNMGLLTVSGIVALTVLQRYPLASRDLAGAATEGTIFYYQRLGAAGYGFIYGSVFLSFGLLNIFKIEKRKSLKTLFVFEMIILYILIIMASYAIALACSIIFLTMFIFVKGKSRYPGIMILMLIIVVVLFYSVILSFLAQIFSAVSLPIVSKHFNELLAALTSNDYDSMKRAQLYMVSIDSFLKSPFFGERLTGGHSHFLDMLGRFGIFVGIVYIAFIQTIFKAWKKFIANSQVVAITLVFWIIVVLNPFSSMTLISILFMLLPSILYITNQEDAETENRTVDYSMLGTIERTKGSS